jgi:hypothetical protein
MVGGRNRCLKSIVAPSVLLKLPKLRRIEIFPFLPDISRSFPIVTVQSVSVAAQATLAISAI